MAAPHIIIEGIGLKCSCVYADGVCIYTSKNTPFTTTSYPVKTRKSAFKVAKK